MLEVCEEVSDVFGVPTSAYWSAISSRLQPYKVPLELIFFPSVSGIPTLHSCEG